jgi:hypothetical protein
MSNIERDERVWFIHGPTGWTKFDREPGYAVRATGRIEILGPLVPASQLAGAVEALREHQRAFDEIDSAMHELDDAEALDAIVGIVNRTRGQ